MIKVINVEKKKDMIRHGERMIEWLQKETERMKSITPRTRILNKRIESYEWNIKTRKERVAKHKQDIQGDEKNERNTSY